MIVEPTGSGAEAAVSSVNRAFYDAFEAGDIDAMSDLWEHSDRVTCTHPGWTVLRGWGSVGASFAAIFGNGSPLQFILTNERAEVAGDVGWVTVDENIIGQYTGSTVTALNVFVRDGEGWRMVAHHGSVVAIGEPDGPDAPGGLDGPGGPGRLDGHDDEAT